MTRIVMEEDHFLKIVPVVLDPATPEAHRRAVADFFAHDEPDFLGLSFPCWRGSFLAC
jgi:hypothetical protein